MLAYFHSRVASIEPAHLLVIGNLLQRIEKYGWPFAQLAILIGRRNSNQYCRIAQG